MSEMKNTQNWINSRLHISVENIIELEDSNRSYPNETERKITEEKEQSINELWNKFKLPNMCVIGVTKGNGGTEKIFEKILAQIFF